MNKKPVFLFAALLSACAVCAQTYSPEVEKKIKEVETHLGTPIQRKEHPWFTLQERMAQYRIPGISIAVVHDHKIEWARGYGWADVAEKRPVTVHTLFQAASISKSLNGVGLLRLAQEKKVDLYADINTYLRSWKFPYDSLSRGKKISVANLLSHTGGLTVHGFPGYEKGVSMPTAVQVLNGTPPANTAAVRSMYAPGIKSEYSGGGTTITQVIVMDVTGEAYDRWMAEHVLRPMGMTESFYTQPAPADKVPVLATAYHSDGAAVPGKYHIYPEEAPAGLWTNPTDLGRYIIETQLSYAGRSAKVLDAEHTRLRLTPYVDSSAALGVFITKAGGVAYFQHGGSNEGFRCQYYGTVDGGEGVIVMVNSDNGGILNEVVAAVATVYGWKDFYHPTVKTTVKLGAGELAAWVGRYRHQKQGVYLTLAVEGDHLLTTLEWENGRTIQLFPESATKLFAPQGVEFTIEALADGKVKTIDTGDGDIFDRVEQ